MLGFLKSHTRSSVSLLPRLSKGSLIGVDISDEGVRIAQLCCRNGSVSLLAGGCKNLPEQIAPGSSQWQRWAIEALCELMEKANFRGRDVAGAIPASETFVELMKLPKTKEGSDQDEKLQEAIFAKIKQKLPLEPQEAMLRYVASEDNNLLVMAADRKVIERHLAIYEKAGLQIKTMGIWPMALVNTYTKFFGRRQEDVESVVMLLDIEPSRTNVVICRHKGLLFARSIPIGAGQLNSDEPVARLAVELTACKRQLSSTYKQVQIERLIFLSGQPAYRDRFVTIARQLEMPAQIGDCLAAVKVPDAQRSGIDRRDCQVSWAKAFGLSLSS